MIKKSVLVLAVLLLGFFSFVFYSSNVSAVFECTPITYDFSKLPSNICDYGVSLDGFSGGKAPCREPNPPKYVDGVMTGASTCNDTYKRQQETLNCLFALSNNSYWRTQGMNTWDNTFGKGLSNFTINGQNCKVNVAASLHRPYYTCCRSGVSNMMLPSSTNPTGLCLPVKDTQAGNYIEGCNEYYSTFMVNLTCDGVNKRYNWIPGYTSFNVTTRSFVYGTPGASSNSAFFGYNRSLAVSALCDSVCIPCTVSAPFVSPLALSPQTIVGNPFVFTLTDSIYYLSKVTVLVDAVHANTNGTIITSQGNSNTLLFTNKLRTFNFLNILPGPIQKFNLSIAVASGSYDVKAVTVNATGMCGPGCVQRCLADKDGDGYTNGTFYISSVCSGSYYNTSHFKNLNNVDCDDNNDNVWRNVFNLGLDFDKDGFIASGDVCQTRCVGLNNSDNVYSVDGLVYNLSYCNPAKAVDCDDTIPNKDNSCGSLTGTVWEDLMGNPINDTSLGDTVAMVAQTKNLSFFDTNVNYNVSRNSQGLDSVLDDVGPPTSSFAFWKTNSSGLNTIYNATVTSGGIVYSSLSGFLNISNSGNSSSDFSPRAIIDFPQDEAYIALGKIFTFRQSSYDEDDLLNLTWDYGDGGSASISSISNYSLLKKTLYNVNLGNGDHLYLGAGRYEVSLMATEERRAVPQKNRAVIHVIVLSEGINVFPIISAPEEGSVYGRGPVVLNASQTYVLNCSSKVGDMQINDFTTADGSMNCSYIKAPGNPIEIGANLTGNYKLLFTWSITDGGTTYTKTGYWTDSSYYGENGVVEFLYNFANSGRHDIGLTVSYLPN